MKLDQKYNRNDFLEFLENFLPDDFSEKEEDIVLSKDRSKQIDEAAILGVCDSLGLHVLEMEHESENDPRITIATDAFKILADHWIHRALVIFKSKNSENYRLSLLTITLDLNEKNKAIKKYSNARRYSFFLGSGAKVNTPTKYLISKGRVTDVDDLKERFSLEVVNKDFYKEIAHLFAKLVGGSYGNGKNKKEYETLLKLPSSTEKSQVSLEFAVRLIGRVIFCWFLREKKSPNDVSLMPNELVSLDAVKKNKDYYHSVLEPIFFEILNKRVRSRKDKYINKDFDLIPYLNGGLFSPQSDDFYSYNEGKQVTYHNIVVVPDSWLKEFFEFLDTYNFTIDENISFDEELSIDPEMLGRIFENLLAEINPETGESARKNTGSYYTPRTIVDYMVDESIFVYLKDKTGINEERLRAVISYDLLDDQKYPLSEDEQKKIVSFLSEIKILDPACGSGAFPIGALQKIVFILQQVDPDGHNWFKQQIKDTSPEIRRIIEREFKDKNFDYIRKLGVIRENIFGVDIQPIATEISRLRCFLTLVVDESVRDEAENRSIEPLPNLDFKFVTANSLVGLPRPSKNTQKGLFEDRSGIAELQELRNMFFTASGSERDQIKLQFVQVQRQMLEHLINSNIRGHADLTTKLTTWDPFSHKASLWFDPEWMFGIEDGFDIVIGNPPYHQLSKDEGAGNDYKKYLKDRYKTSAGRLNTFIFFIHQGAHMLSKHGVLSFIIPNTILTQEYYRDTRKFIVEKMSLDTIVTYDGMLFDNAIVENVTLIIRSEEKNNHAIKVRSQGEEEMTLLTEKQNNNFNVSPDYTFDINSDGITDKMFENKHELLSKHADINQGIALKGDRSKSLSKEKLGENYYKVIDGRNIQKYKVKWDDYFLEYDLDRIHSCKRKDIFESEEKLFFRRVSADLVFAYDADQYFALNTLVVVNTKKESPLKIKYLLALLNSKLINYLYKKKFKSTKKVFSEIQARSVGKLPIKVISETDQNKYVNLVDKILETTKHSDYLDSNKMQEEIQKYQGQVDQMVFKLYGLTKEEIQTIDNNE